jgi:transcriptional regulator with XRE-family HTH domain
LATTDELQGNLPRFSALLNYHLVHGTSAIGKPATPSGRWTVDQLSKHLGVERSTVSFWKTGRAFPTVSNFSRIIDILFGVDKIASPSARQLIASYNEGPFYFSPPSLEYELDKAATQQVPAAFRFDVHDGKIDALSETPQNINETISNDLYDELRSKARALADRLKRTNIDPNAIFAVERLLDGLSEGFHNVRPGIVLSRMRGLQAIHDAFSTDLGRESLFPNDTAMIDDVCLSGQDFLATFPIVRQIERECIALQIEKTSEIIRDIQTKTEMIQDAAAASDAVAPGAIEALRANEPDIAQAKNVEQAADLIADNLLVFRNFVSAAVRFVTQTGLIKAADAWLVIKPDFQEGARAAARILPPLAVIALLTSIAGPVAGLAGILRGDIFKPITSAISKLQMSETRSKRRKKGR